ncbi:crossover junction endodeoxyribonuclease RuvC [Candidatus Babeliales bacterium]|nr:crossover junction endodeoxyribonuclease RuvC [Candidatus Babeliales bacterium]MCF7899111.1 crossover junction endodeoxyribonuclease RuvC [Candidatus Babeliales bacterium]
METNVNSNVILGIDPGFHITGYSVLKVENNKTFVLDFGYLKLDSNKHLSQRAGVFYEFFNEKINKFQVKQLALETPFLGKNAQTFLKLGYLRGILYLLSDQNKLSIYEFSPREIKVAVTGFGGAGKEQVALMVLSMFPKLNELGKIEKNDVTDALAVGICGIWKIKQNYLLNRF